MSSQIDSRNGVSSAGPEYAEASGPNDRDLAEATVREAQQKRAEANARLRYACQAAAAAGQKLRGAETHLRSKRSALDAYSQHLDPGARTEMESELESDFGTVQQIEAEANEANAWVKEAEQGVAEADTALARATHNAQRLMRSAGETAVPIASPFARDGFAGIDDRREQAQLFGTAARMTREEKIRAGTQRLTSMSRNPAGAASFLEQLLASDESEFQTQFLASAQCEIAEMAAGLFNRAVSGHDSEQVTEGLGSLLRCAEGLDPATAESLAEPIAAALMRAKDPHVQQALAQAFRSAMRSGPNGACLCAQLAAGLESNGHGEIGGMLLIAMHDALDEARARFERAARKSGSLNQRLGKQLRRSSAHLGTAQLLKAMNGFKDRHLEDYAESERAAKHLAALAEGAARAIDLSGQNRLPKSDSTCALLAQALGSLAHLDLLAETAWGRRTLHEALGGQRKGKRTLLDVLPMVAGTLSAVAQQEPSPLEQLGLDPKKFVSQGAPFLFSIGQRIGEWVAPRLLAHRRSGETGAAVELLTNTLRANAELFGISAHRIPQIAEAYAAIAYARTSPAVKEAMSDFSHCLERSMSADAGWVRSPVLRALAWVMALPSLIFDISRTRSAELADGLGAAACSLGIEPEQITVIASLLDPVNDGDHRDVPSFDEIPLTASGIKPATKLATAFQVILSGRGACEASANPPDARAVEAMVAAIGVFASPEIKEALADALLFRAEDSLPAEEIPEDLAGFDAPSPLSTPMRLVRSAA